MSSVDGAMGPHVLLHCGQLQKLELSDRATLVQILIPCNPHETNDGTFLALERDKNHKFSFYAAVMEKK